ncbi:tetratricopeptide repeat protein [Aliamphritea spongicola]|uniref:tetratricopeptide repeat protein n=1 Tax=Aliamphritea spongicola TaxID=707589 RepID=UPI00196B534C|nr:tetratricopeptide repeat protein [Aliamphritea spongicola]MBN3562824.1 tetratricopeptide repeat protein [Aliamphritea spongicola]
MEINYSQNKVLIVDNRLDDLAELKGALSQLGIKTIHVASSVNMALALLREETYDICFALFDLGKTEKNGLQLIQEAGAEGTKLYTTTFILVVDQDRSKLLFGSLDTAPDTYISKPYDVAKIRVRLEKILRIKSVLQPLEKLLNQGQLSEALEQCGRYIHSYPGLVLYIHRLEGEILLRLGQETQAVKLFKSLLKRRDLPWARVGLGVALSRLGRVQEAIRVFKGVIQEAHLCVEAFVGLANAHRAIGERRVALDLLRQATLIQPTSPLLQAALGKIALHEGEYSIAAKAYREAIEYSRGGCFEQHSYYVGLVASLQVKVNGSDDADSVQAQESAVKVLEELILAFGDLPTRLIARLFWTELYRARGADPEFMSACHAAFDVYCQCELSEQAQWQELLLDRIRGSDVESEAQQVKEQLNRQVIELDWGKLNVQGMLAYRKQDFAKAQALFQKANLCLPDNPGVVLNLVQVYLESQGQRETVLTRELAEMDDLLWELDFNVLSRKQQNRHKNMGERLAALFVDGMPG